MQIPSQRTATGPSLHFSGIQTRVSDFPHSRSGLPWPLLSFFLPALSPACLVHPPSHYLPPPMEISPAFLSFGWAFSTVHPASRTQPLNWFQLPGSQVPKTALSQPASCPCLREGLWPSGRRRSAGPRALSRAQRMLQRWAGRDLSTVGHSWVTGINSDDEDEQGRRKPGQTDLQVPRHPKLRVRKQVGHPI